VTESRSLAARAVLALVLMVGFYALALGSALVSGRSDVTCAPRTLHLPVVLARRSTARHRAWETGR
jgi:hypothetical protein